MCPHSIWIRELENYRDRPLQITSFHTPCLRRVLQSTDFWPEKIINEELLSRCNQEDIVTIIRKRRWRWIGHVLRKDPQSATRIALHWTLEGKRKRGRPRKSWRRTVESKLKAMQQTWKSITKLAQDRQWWRKFVAAVHTTGCKGQ